MTADAEVLFEAHGRLGLITLNRPQALNAVTLSMVRAMQRQLDAWAEDPAIACVAVTAAGGRAFCAGGDIRQLYEWGRAGDPRALDFYREEYRLNAAIKRYRKPYLALIDGIVMGGGVGVSVHGSHRIGGANTVFAMPETGIGLFPDVGGSYFLPRLPGAVGTWLVLTGARLGQADALWAGVLTHAAPREHFPAIIDGLAAGGDVEAVLDDACGPAPASDLPDRLALIDHCFRADSVEEVLARLEAVRGEAQDWAAGTAATIRTKSPTSLKIALRQMQLGARQSFEDCMRMELRIVSRIVRGHEFYEGVRALIIDKDQKPAWDPPRLDAVDPATIDAYFAPLGEGELALP